MFEFIGILTVVGAVFLIAKFAFSSNQAMNNYNSPLYDRYRPIVNHFKRIHPELMLVKAEPYQVLLAAKGLDIRIRIYEGEISIDYTCVYGSLPTERKSWVFDVHEKDTNIINQLCDKPSIKKDVLVSENAPLQPKIIDDFSHIISFISEKYTDVRIVTYDEFHIILAGVNLKILISCRPIYINFSHADYRGQAQITLTAPNINQLLPKLKKEIAELHYYSTDMVKAVQNIEKVISLLAKLNGSIGKVTSNPGHYLIQYENTYYGNEGLQFKNALKSVAVRWDFVGDDNKHTLHWEFNHPITPMNVARKISIDIEDFLNPPNDYRAAYNY